MHEFDLLCLEPIKKIKPKDVKKVRLREHMSQPVFAMLLNVSPSAVKKWETGENTPSGAALRLLQIIDKNGLGVISDNLTHLT
jgi:putative transcriptional regulator